MNTENLSSTYLTNGGELTQHIEKEDIYLLLANTMPENVQLKDALSGTILFLADIIHQMGPEKGSVLEISKHMLDCEYHIFQEKFEKE